MPMDFTTLGLVAAIKRKGSIPTSQNLYLPEDFVAIANDELISIVIPLIMSVREEYFVTHIDLPITSAKNYPIPAASVGMKLRDVAIVTNPNTNQEQRLTLPRLVLEQVNNTTGFYVEDNEIILCSVPQQTGVLRFYYIRRPYNLVYTTKAGRVTSINPNTNEIVLSNIPSDWAINTKLSVIEAVSPFNIKIESGTIINLSSPTIELDNVTNIEIGDWVTLEGDSVVPMIPVEAHPYLAQLSCVKCLEGLGDREGMSAAQSKANELKESLLTMISPRVDSAPKKITNCGNGIFDWNRR